MANPSTFNKTQRDGVLTLFDSSGFGGANSLDVEARAVSAPVRHIAEPVVTMIRGAIDTVRRGNDQPMEITFEVPLRQFTNGSQEVLVDALFGTGACAGWTKQDSNIEQFNLGVRLTIEGTTHADTADHYIQWLGCVPSMPELTEGEESVLSITLTCYRPSTVTQGGPA